jgi:hypothetical protein
VARDESMRVAAPGLCPGPAVRPVRASVRSRSRPAVPRALRAQSAGSARDLEANPLREQCRCH